MEILKLSLFFFVKINPFLKPRYPGIELAQDQLDRAPGYDGLGGEDVVHMEIELDQEEEILLAASSISCT